MLSSFSVREARKSDAEQIIKLCIALAEHEGKLINRRPNRHEISARVLHDLMQHTDSCYFVAVSGSEIVGIIKITDKQNGMARISESYVDKEFRKEGVMTSLFARVLGWAAERKIKSLFLTVVKRNESALNFWKSLGFEFDQSIGQNLIQLHRSVNHLIAS